MTNLPSAQVPQASAAFVQNVGFFPGASNVNASHATFNDVRGNQYNIHPVGVEMEQNAFIDKLRCALGAGYSSGNHKTCLKGTRTAVLLEIEKWEADQTQRLLYWLKGVAGCGKSTIAQTFAVRSAAGGQLGASFFCSRDFPDRSNLRLIFPTLARHLAHRYPNFKTALVQVLRSNPDLEYDSLAVQLEYLLVRPLQSTGIFTTIVIDALDECKDQEPVSAFLSVLAQFVDAIPNVKIFITGRPEDHIRSGFALPSLQTTELPLHDVHSETVDSDIRLYVKTRLGEVATRRSRSVIGTWPSEEDIAAIIQRSSGLFIVASVIINFIDYPYGMPQNRLKLILSMTNSAIYAGKSVIYDTYRQIFEASFQEVDIDDSEFFDQLRAVIASVVLAFKPLSRASIAKILGTSAEWIWTILSRLHSVLIIPDSDTQPIRICHKSFADFLTDSEQCSDTKYYINRPTHHLAFGALCLKLMNTTLMKNICRFPRYAMNKDIKDLPARRKEYIGDSLAYASESFANHLRSGIKAVDETGNIIELLDDFFKHQILSWLEVLSIEDNLRAASYSLHDVKCWLIDIGTNTTFLRLIDDYERFILRFFDVVKISATHIYHSALPLSPTSSLIRTVYQSHLRTEAKLLSGSHGTSYWDACVRTFPIDYKVQTTAFSHNSTLIAVGGKRHMRIFDSVTGACLTTVNPPNDIIFVVFSLDDTSIVSGLEDKTIRVWDTQTGDLIHTLRGHESTVRLAVFSLCGSMIASCSDDKTVRIWTITSGCCECVLQGHLDVVKAVCWSAIGNQVISGSYDATVRIWDVSTRTCFKVLREHTEPVTSVAASKKSSLLASASLDRTIKTYDPQSGDVLQTISTDDWIYSIRFSTYGNIICAVGRSASMWDLVSNKCVSNTSDNERMLEPSTASFSPDGTRVVAGSELGYVGIWTTDHRESTSEIVDYQSTQIRDIRFMSNGQLLVSRPGGNVEVWDAISGCLFTFHHATFDSIIFSSNSRFVACMTNRDVSDSFPRGLDKRVQVRKVSSRKLVANIDCDDAHHIALSPDGSRLVSLSVSNIRLWGTSCDNHCLASLLFPSPFPLESRASFAADGTGVCVEGDGGLRMNWRICPVPLSNRFPSNVEEPPFQFLPMIPNNLARHQDHEPVPSRGYRYKKGSEWILGKGGKRMLWVLPERRGSSRAFHGKMVAVGAANGGVSIVDFSAVPPS